MREMLAAWNVNATVIDAGELAVESMLAALDEGNPYDLVLMDVQMPGMDGFETTQRIRSSPKIANTRVIMLSSCDASAYGEQCKDLQLAAYLTKPIKQSELLETLMFVLKRSQVSQDGQPVIGADRKEDVSDIKRSLRVLVAEDNFVNQQLMMRVLQKEGHQVLMASHGKEAVDTLRREFVDVVLMDVQMPVLDGYEATKEIRRLEILSASGKPVPIIALTANAMRGDREKCLAAGMDDYASKPIQFSQLFATIDRHVPAIRSDLRSAKSLSRVSPMSLLLLIKRRNTRFSIKSRVLKPRGIGKCWIESRSWSESTTTSNCWTLCSKSTIMTLKIDCSRCNC